MPLMTTLLFPASTTLLIQLLQLIAKDCPITNSLLSAWRRWNDMDPSIDYHLGSMFVRPLVRGHLLRAAPALPSRAGFSLLWITACEAYMLLFFYD